MKNYAEPWGSDEVVRDNESFIRLRSQTGGIVARLWLDVDDERFNDEQRAHARRIVACVNVCAGLPIEQLESAPLGGILNGVAGLVSQRDELLDERSRVGLAIDAALRDGVVPDQHPLRSRLEMLANHRQRELELLAALERLLPWAETMGGMSPDVKYTGDHPLAISRSAIAKAKGE